MLNDRPRASSNRTMMHKIRAKVIGLYALYCDIPGDVEEFIFDLLEIHECLAFHVVLQEDQ